jgi:alkyl sulfatase BDS1-like metallo-beta-lactamase superfamily hydrolase
MSPPTETPNDATPITCAHNRAVLQELVHIDGATAKVVELFGLFDDFPLMFGVVEPKR